MKHRAQSGFVARPRARPVRRRRQTSSHCRVRQPVLRRDPSGVLFALGHRRVVVGQDDERVGARRRRASARAVRTAVVDAGVVRRPSASATGTNAPTSSAGARASSSPSRRGLGRHEAPVAQLGARVSGVANLVEHGARSGAADARSSNSRMPHEHGALATRIIGRMILSRSRWRLGVVPIVAASPDRTGTAVEVTRARAGWRYVHFAVRQIAPGQAVGCTTPAPKSAAWCCSRDIAR